MIAALFLFTAVWFGLLLDEVFGLSRGDRLVRLAAGIVLGTFCAAWLLFLLAWGCGFTDGIIVVGTGLMLGFNLWAWHYRGLNGAWLAALPKPNRSFWLASAVPTAVITVYFGMCVWANPEGDILFRGNTRDLAFHMGTVSAFVEQSAFPPYNPQAAGARLSYHFMANFFAAILNKGGFDLLYALKIPMVLLAFSLCTLTCHLFFSAAKTRAATLFAALLFFFGHVGVVNVLFGLLGYPSGNIPLSLGSWASIEDHITYPYYNFLHVIINFFQPQLPFLAGFPMAMLILVALYRKHTERAFADRTTWFLVGSVAFMPLFHMHTFLTLAPLVGLYVLSERTPRPAAVATHCGVFMRILNRLAIEAPAPLGSVPRPTHREPRASFDLPWTKLGVLGLAALPIGIQLGFILSQQKTAGFSGFDVAKHLGALPEIPDWLHLKRVWFWLRVAGPSLVLGLAGLVWWMMRSRGVNDEDRRGKTALLALLAVAGFYFGVINVYRFTPNWGDSNKFVLYLNVLLCLCAGRWLAHLWEKSRLLKITTIALVCLGSVVPSGIEWALRYRRQPERLFSASDRMVADWIKINTPKDAVFLTANSVVHLVPALAGRRVVNGSYTRETGYADQRTEDTVVRAYREADPFLITSANVTHVMIGPEENGVYRINRAAFARHHRLIFDQPSRNAAYTIYEARPPSLELVRAKADPVDGQAYVGISELEPRVIQQSYGTLKYDRAFNLDPLSLKGHRYANGLGTHANSDLQFNLGGNYDRFEADVGLDDSQLGGAGSVQFEVWVDDRNVYRSPTQRAGDTPAKISVDITGGSILRLVVTDAGDGDHSDHADWAEARLRRRPTPVGESTPNEYSPVTPELPDDTATQPAPPRPVASTNRLWLFIPMLMFLAWITCALWQRWRRSHRSPLAPNLGENLVLSATSRVNAGITAIRNTGSLWRKKLTDQTIGRTPTSGQTTHENARMGPQNWRWLHRFYPWLLTVVFMALAGFGALHHEMWRDEMQAWLIARDLSGIKALIDQAKYEGTPPLWSSLLSILAHFTRRPEAMQVLTWLLAVATFLVFCLRAPLTAAQKGLLTCNYFLVYQYGTVCRNYLIGILGLALACAVMLAPKPKQILGVLCLLLAVFASVHSFILAIALAAAFWIPSAWLCWPTRNASVGGTLEADQVTGRDTLRYLILFGSGAALAAYLVAPSSEVNYGPAMHWNLVWMPEHLAKICWAFITSQFTWPRPPGFFWIPGWDTPFRSFDDRVAISGAALLWLSSILFFIRSPRALLAYVMGTLGVALFLYTKYLGFIRHTGFLFICFLCAYWIFFALSGPSSISSKSWRFRLPRKALTAMLLCQAITGVWALREDYRHPFSCGKATADYLIKNGFSEDFIAVAPDWAGAPIAGYMDRTLYYPYAGRMGSFTRWNNQRREFMPDPELYNDARAAAPAGAFILILDHPLTESFRTENGIELLAKIGGSLTPFEDYYIHRCK